MTDSWPPATATGTGSMPGSDPLAAANVVFGTVSLPFLCELPDRGVGADLVARGTGFFSGLYVDLQPAGWRLVPRPGVDTRRTRDLLARDLDALEEAGQKWEGPLKLQLCGPWTLAAMVETHRGGQLLADASACRDLAESLAEGVAEHVVDIRQRLPGVTTVYVQLDEPMLGAVTAGHIKTASGFGTVRIPEARELANNLTAVFDGAHGGTAGDVRVGVHSCATLPPIALMISAGAQFLSLDLVGLQSSPLDDQLGEALEAGVGLIAGVVPTAGPLTAVRDVLHPLRELAGRLGMSPEMLSQVAVSPACGLPDRPLALARAALTRASEAAQELADV